MDCMIGVRKGRGLCCRVVASINFSGFSGLTRQQCDSPVRAVDEAVTEAYGCHVEGVAVEEQQGEGQQGNTQAQQDQQGGPNEPRPAGMGTSEAGHCHV